MTTPLSVRALLLLGPLILGVQPSSYACDERAPTRSASLGPHDFSVTPIETNLWREGDAGEPLLLRARVLDTCGTPVESVRIQILHANQDGDHEPDRWRGLLVSDARGEFQVITVFPGYAGGLPRHIHFILNHPRYQPLVTRLFFKSDPAVDESIEDLAIVLEEIQRKDGRGWVGGFEFVLSPR